MLNTRLSHGNGRARFWITAFLVGATLLVYLRTLRNGFVFDDGQYLLQNPAVQKGLTAQSICWAFRSMKETANWHPVTWLSHLLDVSLYGLSNAAGHHFTSVAFHTANVVLIFLLLNSVTRSVWQSGLVAAFFGLHPLRVESVAWVAERKDVLSTLFGLLALQAYVWYAGARVCGRQRAWTVYLLVLVLFAVGLMCKPMVVTLPFLMLLMDYWPLRRIRGAEESSICSYELDGGSHTKVRDRADKYSSRLRGNPGQSNLQFLLIEKLPLFLMSGISCVITIIAQHRGGAVPSLSRFPIEIRVTNAAVSYLAYIGKMVWPRNLAAFYTHGQWHIGSWQFLGAVAVIGMISDVALILRRRYPYILVGWLWYMGSLVPVIGIVQVGGQGMADRYTYLPMVGLFIIIVWGIGDLFGLRAGNRCRSPILGASAVVAIVGLMACTWMQLGYWHDEITLFSRAIAVTKNNSLAHVNLGRALSEVGKFDDAILHYARALEISPHYVIAHVNMGYALVSRGKLEEGKKHYLEAINLDPKCAEAHNNLGVALVSQGDIDGAIREFREAVRLKPEYGPAVRNLRRALGLKRKSVLLTGHGKPGSGNESLK